ncbi:hypothetical protein EDD11_000922 [Mortierella claussenii]|nr:hypothetical protein EDD11_000922 [Mortierella claussenii]
MFSSARPSILSTLCRSRFASLSPSPITASPLQQLASIRFQSSSSPTHKPIRDTSYPFPLFYHLLTSANASSHHIHTPAEREPPSNTSTAAATSSEHHSTYALSFLPTFPQHNRQVIGFLSHHTSSPSSADELRVMPNKFTENEAFNTLLHDMIQKNLNKDPMVDMVLQQQLEGWTHIADYRNPAPFGRIPLPEDIFGSVQIIDGAIQSSTYQRMPSHRIVSSNGLFQLSEYLHGKLVDHLQNL